VSVSVETAAYVRPMPGEYVGGDAAVIRDIDDGLLVAIVDVLGHGSEANELASQIADFLNRTPLTEPEEVMEALHRHIRGSRGAAAGISRISTAAGTLSYVGHGNTQARRLWRNPARLISRDGLIGSHVRSAQAQTMTLSPGDVLVFYTDGVKDRFELSDYRHAISDTPRFIARNVVEMFGKEHDDAACIAVKVGD
jgi:serine phosphatase RsbU (regulator of sigma subunit)